MTNQERSDLLRTAKKIEKNADLYERCPIFKGMVDNTIWLTPDQIHESQRLAPSLQGPYRYNDVIEEAPEIE
jgi:hypothetical protein